MTEYASIAKDLKVIKKLKMVPKENNHLLIIGVF